MAQLRRIARSRSRRGGLLLGAAIGGVAIGCNSFDDPPPPNADGPQLIIPTDSRTAVTSAASPPPISGGTLQVLQDGSTVIASDPDRDTVSIVDLGTLAVRQTLRFGQGDEPGRVVEESPTRVHVALRRGGAIVTFDPTSGAVLQRRSVCAAPRGMAFDPATKLLHVACAEGRLVSLGATDATPSRSIELGPDLRDVLVRGNQLWVTRFKSAEIVRVQAGVAVDPVRIADQVSQMVRPQALQDGTTELEQVSTTTQAEVAWRSVPIFNGGVAVVHQFAVRDEIVLTPPTAAQSAYGGSQGDPCGGGIVQNALTMFGADGSLMSSHVFGGPPLPVDVAVSPDQQWMAVAHAGIADPQAPLPFTVFPGGQADDPAPPRASFSSGTISLINVYGPTDPGSGCNIPTQVFTGGPVTSVAFAPDGRLIAQSREPAQLQVLSGPSWSDSTTIVLSDESHLDTGHEIFHRDAGAGIACASCHPEGGEDGHVWRFAGTGPRRTQALNIGLAGTAPFHWEGDMADVGALMNQVFVGRMGGVVESQDRLDVMTSWLFGIQPPAPTVDANDSAALAGKALFESPNVGCNGCHAGAKFTNNQSVSIGKSGDALQVPSLIGVAYRAPFLHDGCAPTLADRFDPTCGGTQHGNTANLTQAEIGNLVAYLGSL